MRTRRRRSEIRPARIAANGVRTALAAEPVAPAGPLAVRLGDTSSREPGDYGDPAELVGAAAAEPGDPRRSPSPPSPPSPRRPDGPMRTSGRTAPRLPTILPPTTIAPGPVDEEAAGTAPDDLRDVSHQPDVNHEGPHMDRTDLYPDNRLERRTERTLPYEPPDGHGDTEPARSVKDVAAHVVRSMRAVDEHYSRHVTALENEAARRCELLMAQAELDAELIRLQARREAHSIVSAARLRVDAQHEMEAEAARDERDARESSEAARSSKALTDDIDDESAQLREIGETFSRFAEAIETTVPGATGHSGSPVAPGPRRPRPT